VWQCSSAYRFPTAGLYRTYVRLSRPSPEIWRPAIGLSPNLARDDRPLFVAHQISPEVFATHQISGGSSAPRQSRQPRIRDGGATPGSRSGYLGPMSISKTVRLSGGSSESIEDAIRTVLARAAVTIRDIERFDVVNVGGKVDGAGAPTDFRVTLDIVFKVREAIQGE
jgi:flavin-binding protein dodecin